jgi:hypothetical protein
MADSLQQLSSLLVLAVEAYLDLFELDTVVIPGGPRLSHTATPQRRLAQLRHEPCSRFSRDREFS